MKYKVIKTPKGYQIKSQSDYLIKTFDDMEEVFEWIEQKKKERDCEIIFTK